VIYGLLSVISGSFHWSVVFCSHLQ